LSFYLCSSVFIRGFLLFKLKALPKAAPDRSSVDHPDCSAGNDRAIVTRRATDRSVPAPMPDRAADEPGPATAASPAPAWRRGRDIDGWRRKCAEDSAACA